jgi:threonine dehydrogenase-like Zn-dependent dehydrogenase
VKALVFERSLPRFAAARIAGMVAPGRGAKVGPLSLDDVDPPELPAAGWVRVRPRLAGICGSDLATIDAASSRWFEPIVSFPFVPGHEVVGDVEGGGRVVVEPVLGCAARGVDPPCPACAAGRLGNCERIAHGHLRPGLQTGYCADTGGGWGLQLVAHPTQVHAVPGDLDDEAAVMVEPAACATHAALAVPDSAGVVVVLGAGTIGLCAIAALRRFRPPATLVAVAKHPEQQSLASDLGADVVVTPGELVRGVRRATGTLMVDGRLAGGADAVVDCVGSAASVGDALAVTRPRGRIVLAGMPGEVSVDLTPLWQREVELRGAYAYGTEAGGRRTFDLAFELVRSARLGRLVSATYPLDRYEEALAHAAEAGRRGAVKIAFDLRGERQR